MWPKKIFLGADHAGFELKELVERHLKEKGHKVEDLGTHSTESTDYPDNAKKVAKAVAKAKGSIGVLCCGSGMGVCMVANRVKGARAALCHNEQEAGMARQHNDANILCMGGRTFDKQAALKILEKFLATPFSGEDRHKRRIKKIDRSG